MKPFLTPHIPFHSEFIILPLSHHRALFFSVLIQHTPWASSDKAVMFPRPTPSLFCQSFLCLPLPPHSIPDAQKIELKNKELRGF